MYFVQVMDRIVRDDIKEYVMKNAKEIICPLT